MNRRDFSQPNTIDVGGVETMNPAAGDLAVEGMVFIAAEDSTTGSPLLVTANEVSGTTTIFEITGGHLYQHNRWQAASTSFETSSDVDPLPTSNTEVIVAVGPLIGITRVVQRGNNGPTVGSRENRDRPTSWKTCWTC